MIPSMREEALGDIWYGGLVLAFTYHNLEFKLNIVGDVRGSFTYTEKGKVVTEEFTDKNNDGLLGKLLHQAGFYKDSDIGYDFDEAKVNLHLLDNNWAELSVYDYKTSEYYDEDVVSLYNVISGGVQNLLDWFKDKVDVNYQLNENGSSYDFLERLQYEEYCEDWCKAHNYPYEDLAKAFSEDRDELPASYL